MEIVWAPDTPPFAAYAVNDILGLNARISCDALRSGVHAVLTAGDATVHGDGAIARFLARSSTSNSSLYPAASALQASRVDQWMDFALSEIVPGKEVAALAFLDAHLASRPVLVDFDITLADVAVWAALTRYNFAPSEDQHHVRRWLAHVHSVKSFKKVVGVIRGFQLRAEKAVLKAKQDAEAAKVAAAKADSGSAAGKGAAKGKKDKAVEATAGAGAGAGAAADAAPAGDAIVTADGVEIKGLPIASCPPLIDAVDGAVCTRFPPEPSGYLHIGHLKALMLNNYYARRYHGRLLLRFDDTNPSKEKEEYEHSIIEDMARIGIVPDAVSHTSDFFAQCADYARKLIRDGNGYMDNTEVEQMRAERMEGIESKCRSMTPEQALELFEGMLTGAEHAKGYCLRAKIDMKLPNKAMRDPVMYRANETPHARTGRTWAAYPTYDFACPIVDALEGVTHALRTTEYRDRDAQYLWVIKALALRHVHIQEFARLNFQHTLMSKRKLQWLVDAGEVQSWQDPRFPTIQGIIRRGVQLPALRAFILSQGFSTRNVDMEWDKFWSTNSRVLDVIASRYMAVAVDSAVPLHITNYSDEPVGVPVLLHPQRPELGNKTVLTCSRVFIEHDDAAEIASGEEVTLMRWGNVVVSEVAKDAEGRVTHLVGTFNKEGDFKATKKKITWVANTPSTLRVKLVEFDHLVSKKTLDKDDDFREFLTSKDHPTRVETLAYADPNLRTLQNGDTVQLERRAYFRCDVPHLDDAHPCTLFMVPDGKAKAMSKLSKKLAHR